MTRLGAHIWIHGWSMAHGCTAAATAQSPDGGHFILTGETITAVAMLSKLCGCSWSRAFIETFVQQQFAQRVGLTLAQLVAGKIPVGGNIFNGVSSLAITEAILWETYRKCAA